MRLYQFEKIYSHMAKEFGKLNKREENEFSMIFFSMEGNALKIHRQYPQSNSRRLREAIALVLFDIQNHFNESIADPSSFRDGNNGRLEHALLMAFDPETNDEIKQLLGPMDLKQLHEYYKAPVMCLLRIKDSIDFWEKHGGANGYFDYFEETFGPMVNDSKLDFAVLTPPLVAES